MTSFFQNLECDTSFKKKSFRIRRNYYRLPDLYKNGR